MMSRKWTIFQGLSERGDYIRDKKRVVSDNIGYMINRLCRMFEYENIPENIPKNYLDLYLFQNGECFFTKIEDDYYIFTGGQGGELDAYYRPTIYTVANPALNLSKNFKIGVDGVLIKNDTLEKGLIPLLYKYNSLLSENLLSLKLATINARTLQHFSASDDATKLSAEKYLNDLENGKMGVIGENAFLDGVKVHNVGNSSSRTITELIELQQYIQAVMFNEIGLDANYNMKRESISSNEAELNDDFLLPLVENMLECRENAFKEIKKMYGVEIKVRFNSSWRTNYLEDKAEKKLYIDTINGENPQNVEDVHSGLDETEEVKIEKNLDVTDEEKKSDVTDEEKSVITDESTEETKADDEGANEEVKEETEEETEEEKND